MQLELKNVSYTYGKGTVFEVNALSNIDLMIEEGQFIGIIGHTGSGKSTLIQHFNALMQPTEGKVFFEGEDILLLCRTAMNGANSYHNSNYSTFDRIKGFRGL